MPLNELDLGQEANDQTGDKLRIGGSKINENFTFLNEKIDNLTKVIPVPTVPTTGEANILYVESSTGQLKVWNGTSYDLYGGEELTYDKLIAALGFTPLNSNQKGSPNGVAETDENNIILSQHLPSYVDDVLEGNYVNDTTFNDPNGTAYTPENGKIYIDSTSNKQYRWGGTKYVETVSSPGSTDALAEGTTNLYFTVQRVRETLLEGLSLLNTDNISSADNLIHAIGKLQAQIININTEQSGVSTDQDNALSLGADGKPFLNTSQLGGSNTSSSGIDERYLTITALIAGQNGQIDAGLYRVDDASEDPTVTSGRAYYEYLGTINGTLADYYKFSEQESLDVESSFKAELEASTAETTVLDADVFGYLKNSASNALRKITFANIKATLKTYFDTLYAPIGGSTYTPPSNYGTVAAMLADQANQLENEEYTVNDASDYTLQTLTGWATFQKKSTSTASQTDYDLREQFDVDASSGVIGFRSFNTSSDSGAVDDADISLGSTTFGTDSTTKLQALLDEALNGPIYIIWDGRYSVSDTLIIHSNTIIWCMPGCGVILRNASNCFLIQNANVVDPVAPYDGSNIIDENIVIENMILNGNGYNTGSGGDAIFDTANNGSATKGSAQTKRNQIIDFHGVRNLKMKNVQFLASRYWATHFVNIHDSYFENIIIDFGLSSTRDDYNYDGFNCHGGINNMVVNGIIFRNCKDDNIALNCMGHGFSFYLDEEGPITNVKFDDVYFDDSEMGIGLYCDVPDKPLDNVIIRNLKGSTKTPVVRIHNGENGINEGPGAFGSITIEDVNVQSTGTSNLHDYGQLIDLRAIIERITLRNIQRNTFVSNDALIGVSKNISHVKELIIDNIQLTADASGFEQPVVQFTDGIVEKCIVSNIQYKGDSLNSNTPIIKVNGANAELHDLIIENIETENVNQIVNNSLGVLKNIVASNIIHRGVTTPAFVTNQTVESISLSNYKGVKNPLSGTFVEKRGSSLDYLGEFFGRNLPVATDYAGSTVSISDEDNGYTRAFSDGVNWRRVYDYAIAVYPTLSVLFSDLFTGTSIDTNKWTVTNPDSANINISQNDRLLFTRLTDTQITPIQNNNIETINSYAKGGSLSVKVAKETGFENSIMSVRWRFNGNVDYIGIQQNPTDQNWRIIISKNSVLEYDLYTSIPVQNRVKITYDNSNNIKFWYWNGSIWVQFGATQNFDLGASGSVQLASRSDSLDDAGDVLSFDDLYITTTDYSTELP